MDDLEHLSDETSRQIEELRQQIKARDEFLATVAHELRNPMTPISVQVQLLLKTARRNDKQSQEMLLPRLERLQYAIDHYIRRTTTLLELSRISSGARPLEWAELDLSRLVREVLESQAVMAEHAGSSVTSDLQDGIIGTWDALAMEQVAENLISNAIKYGAGKPIAVSLTASAGTARLAVRDNGIGISEEDQKRIFGHFERAVTHHAQGGFGIGLWVVHRLVTAMHGEISVASRPGEGSTFTVTLPLRREAT